MLRIGDFSKLSRVSIRMLRHYDEIGLLIPEHVDNFTGYRYYSETQLPLANRIHALKEMGFTLSTITEVLRTYHDPQALREFLLIKQAEVKEQAKKTAHRLQSLETIINRLGKDENAMNYNVVLKEMPQRLVASIRKSIPSYNEEGILWEELMKEITHQHVQLASPCYAIAVFHDQEYEEHDPDIEIQLSVQGTYKNKEHVVFKTVPPITVASATFQGGYEHIAAVNQAVANWVRDNRYEFAGSMFNIYHVSPAQSPNPDEWVTEVCFPVRKK
ncbi:MerR family transcriptional regulator [Propionispora hippei]|uniref:DNA-binding transcriptional regulator, MerR family n=1 Tax=Propionispora hippei DSM 15287 TaxID=1123003 RepID=A0A1M6H137_9FIRM|nr:MerR family transcriptional regulator [Propionispora hippei]SHJ15901.1 DNA-binding transcriptional regulator, MerR family [Propionispora hippei DSM 15287]